MAAAAAASTATGISCPVLLSSVYMRNYQLCTQYWMLCAVFGVIRSLGGRFVEGLVGLWPIWAVMTVCVRIFYDRFGGVILNEIIKKLKENVM